MILTKYAVLQFVLSFGIVLFGLIFNPDCGSAFLGMSFSRSVGRSQNNNNNYFANRGRNMNRIQNRGMQTQSNEEDQTSKQSSGKVDVVVGSCLEEI